MPVENHINKQGHIIAIFDENEDASGTRFFQRNTKAIRVALTVLVSTFAVVHIPTSISWFTCRQSLSHYELKNLNASGDSVCPQAEAVTPFANNDIWKALSEYYSTDSFLEQAVDWLGGAVKIPTESFDNMGPIGEDERWDIFGDLHAYLHEKFPLVHSALQLTKVNTYGLLYHWEGTDTTLKPLLLMAHQDVVPVDPQTVDQWEKPPFCGCFDGKMLWGRGSTDDKSGLIAILISIEMLIDKGFIPTRSIVLSFGFDEEASGVQGAQSLADYLLEVYGEYSFAMVIDEGSGFSKQFGAVIATPAITEKGYLDVRVEVASPGGHSSIPPAHTSIGILSALLVAYESSPYPVKLGRDSPVYGSLQCLAEYAPELDTSMSRFIKESARSDAALREVESFVSKDVILRSLVGTTQAIDLVGGGVKTNALPETAWAIVNHRIATQSSVGEVQAHNTALLQDLAESFNLSFTAFGQHIDTGDGPKYGALVLSDAWASSLEPAPITPTGQDALPYRLLSGTIKSTYNEFRRNERDVKDIIVSPGIMSGNTDTRCYWKLTRHIFRYNHLDAGEDTGLANIHTVNESLEMKSFVEEVLFFTTLILNADENKDL